MPKEAYIYLLHVLIVFVNYLHLSNLLDRLNHKGIDEEIDKQIVVVLESLVELIMMYIYETYTIDINQIVLLISLGLLFAYEKATFREKVFNHYINLPPELRMEIIEQMEVRTRCQFSGCSTLCNKEVRRSKNYIYGLEIEELEFYVNIIVAHKPSLDHHYTLKFQKQIMTCMRGNGNDWEDLWSTRWLGRKSRIEYSIDYFKGLLKMYQNRIRKLSIKIKTIPSINLEIDNLKNLEELVIHGGVNIKQLLTKTSNKLNNLHVESWKNLKKCKKIYHLQQKLYAPCTCLNNKQFLRLSAADVSINIGSLTENDIYDFIRSWQHGTIGKEIKKYKWIITNSMFNVATVFRLCGGELNGASLQYHVIYHYTKAEIYAILAYSKPNSDCRHLWLTQYTAIKVQ